MVSGVTYLRLVQWHVRRRDIQSTSTPMPSLPSLSTVNFRLSCWRSHIMAWKFGFNKSREPNFPSTLSLQDCSGLRPPIDWEQADKFCCGKPFEFHGFSLLAVCVTTFSNMKDRKEWCEQDRKWKESNGFSFNDVEFELSAEAPKCSRSH